MLVLGLGAGLLGIGGFCWLLFIFAVYALPCFLGLTAAIAAYHNGSGVLGAIALAVGVAAITVFVGQILFATIRSPIVRTAIRLLFAAPAAVAGYHVALGFGHIAGLPPGWREAFALIGALAVGATAWMRMTMWTPARNEAATGAVQSSSPAIR
jgi:hypothetical protein